MVQAGESGARVLVAVGCACVCRRASPSYEALTAPGAALPDCARKAACCNARRRIGTGFTEMVAALPASRQAILATRALSPDVRLWSRGRAAEIRADAKWPTFAGTLAFAEPTMNTPAPEVNITSATCLRRSQRGRGTRGACQLPQHGAAL